MKRKLIALCISSLLVGSGIVFNMNQDVAIPTVEKFTEDTSTCVSKHEAIVSEPENVDKDEKTSTRNTIKKLNPKKKNRKKRLQAKVNPKRQVFLRKVRYKIRKKKFLQKILLVQIKRVQLPTVQIYQINRTMML